MAASINAFRRFITLLEKLERRYWWMDLSKLRRDVEENRFRVLVPNFVNASFKRPGIADLGFFWCKNCGRIGLFPRDYQWLGSDIVCKYCGNYVTQAFVGAPRARRARERSIEYYYYITPGWLQRRAEYRILPIRTAIDGYCRILKKYKLLVIIDEDRPLATLTFKCPDRSRPCPQRDSEGFCLDRYGRRIRLFFGRRGELRYFPSQPSEALIKPLVLSTYDARGGNSIDYDKNALPGVEEVRLAPVTVYEICILLLLGHPYARYSERIPLVVADSEGPVMLGRKLKTEGILFRLKSEIVEHAHKLLRERGFSEERADGLVITHTFAHAVLNALPILTGLSPSEFGEAIWTYEEGGYYEILIYDNSKGSIGGVRSIVYNGRELLPDLYAYLPNSADCTRGCEVACRACTFFERCGMLNYVLNRHAIPYIVDLDYCRRQWSPGVPSYES